jgi:hypothetical protein
MVEIKIVLKISKTKIKYFNFIQTDFGFENEFQNQK